MKTPAILVADDDPEVLNYLETALLCHKYPVIAARDGSEALSLLEENKNQVSTVVLDAMMPCKDGIETLHEIRRLYPELPVVMISGASDPERIVNAMKTGAQEYLTKPVDHEKLLAAIRRTTASQPPRQESESTKPETAAAPSRYVMVNARMLAISEALRKTASWNVPVVLRGESGVGKEVLARELHLLSPRASKEFVKINCVALPSELLESELFGYERGAFTGAFRAKPGKFELADGGTILLDEIGDMDLKLQAKLLQVLQDGEVHRLGGKEPVRVDVRVLVATHCDLEKSIQEGNFREDLYYRLNVVSIEVPPLRERKDEILPLSQHFLEKHCQADAKPPALTEDLKAAFLKHDWPGNVRELENVVRRYLVFEDAPSLARQLLAAAAARTGVRSADDRFADDPAATVEDRFEARHGLGNPGFESGERFAAATGAAGSGAPLTSQGRFAPPPQTMPAGRAPGTPNGHYAAAAARAGASSSLFHHAAEVSADAGDLKGVPRSALEAGPSAQAPRLDPASQPDPVLRTDPGPLPDPASQAGPLSQADPLSQAPGPQPTPLTQAPGRAFQDGEFAGPLLAPQSSDGWMSRLARLESLLGCLVLGASEKLPGASEEPAVEPAPAAPNENGRQFATLGELDEERNRVEMEAILAALEKTEWNRKKAAKLLKTDYKALLYRMKKLGVGERNDQP